MSFVFSTSACFDAQALSASSSAPHLPFPALLRDQKNINVAWTLTYSCMYGHTCVRVGLVASQQGHHHGDALLLLFASVFLALREVACETWAGPFVWHAFRHLQPHLQQAHAGIIQSAYVSKIWACLGSLVNGWGHLLHHSC